MTGKVFGKLTVLEMEKILDKKKHINRTYCLCKCECGAEKLVYPNNLRSGATKSCGCLEQSSKYNRSHYVDITGEIYGRLTIIKKVDRKASNGSQYWLCKCDCGNYTEISYGNLNGTCNNTISCGCANKEYISSIIPNYKDKRFGKLLVLQLTNKRDKRGKCYWKCQCVCGNITYVITSDLTTKNTMSCGLCNCSHGEETIKQLLVKHNIHYTQQKRFDECKLKKTLPFDFYLEDYNVAIEYDGKQHFQAVKHFGGQEQFDKTKERDLIKNNYCKNKNIRLIRFPYTLSCIEIEKEIISIKNP